MASFEGTILVVDDEREIRKVLQLLLEAEGYRVLQAGSAEEALSVVRSSTVDFVISDVRMPGKTGPDLLQELKQAGLLRMPFAFITGYTDLTRDRALTLGAVDLIPKPFSVQRIVDLIQAHL